MNRGLVRPNVLPCNIDCGRTFAGYNSVEDSESASLAYYFTGTAKDERKLAYAKCEFRMEDRETCREPFRGGDGRAARLSMIPLLPLLDHVVVLLVHARAHDLLLNLLESALKLLLVLLSEYLISKRVEDIVLLLDVLGQEVDV